ITLVSLVPTMLARLLDHGWGGRRPPPAAAPPGAAPPPAPAPPAGGGPAPPPPPLGHDRARLAGRHRRPRPARGRAGDPWRPHRRARSDALPRLPGAARPHPGARRRWLVRHRRSRRARCKWTARGARP